MVECLREGDREDAQGILNAIAVTLPTGRLEEGAYDEAGNLYRIPEAVLLDPTNVVEDSTDVDGQTIIGAPNLDTLSVKEIADAGGSGTLSPQDPFAGNIRPDKGKAAVDRDALKVKCRLSDRGGPDVVVLLSRSQTVGLLTQRIRDEAEVGSNRVYIRVF